MNLALAYMHDMTQHAYTINNYNLSGMDRKAPRSTNNRDDRHGKSNI